MDTYLQVWWTGLTLVAIFNAGLWLAAACRLRRRRSTLTPTVYAARRVQLALASVYVFVSGFRSVLPRADVQRICLVDSPLSSVFVGRTVATVAELSFAFQWALFVRELGERTQIASACMISRLLVPLIVWAEISSWYAVLTTNFLGNVIEQSTWTISGALIALAYQRVWVHEAAEMRRFMSWTGAAIACFIFFMCTVDVPLYLSRWSADEQAGRVYLHWLDGVRDSATRWEVVHEWPPWRPEAAWMALYFSVGVWVSIALSQSPAPTPGLSARRASQVESKPAPWA